MFRAPRIFNTLKWGVRTQIIDAMIGTNKLQSETKTTTSFFDNSHLTELQFTSISSELTE